MHSNRPLGARQDPYDAVPRSVQALSIPFGAKLLYGALRTAHNTKWEPTYQQLAEHVNASTRSIVRWVQRLVDAGLIAVRRRGQGLSNIITLLDRVTSGSELLPAPAMTAGRSRPETPILKETFKKVGYTNVARDHESLMTGRYGRYERRE